MIEQVFEHLAAEHEQAIQRLCQWLSIASIGKDGAYNRECQQAAEWIAQELEACGLAASVEPTGGQPAVLGRYDGAPAGSPRVLFYGHYDVQPPDPVDQWDSPPFEPTLRDGRLYARGASDDKGQVMTFVEAVRAWLAVAGSLPVNVTVLIEGEEEFGSPHMAEFLSRHAEALRADVAVVSDTSMWDRNVPAITYALRGLVNFDIELHGPSRDLHSGVYGGTVANPATELAIVLGGLFDQNHRITIDGFDDDVVTLDDTERAQWSDLDFDERDFAASVGLTALHGEAGYSTLERRWARPSCDVNGLYGGYSGEGGKTVIPSFAGAKLSFRLTARQEPAKIEAAFGTWLEERTPPGCRWKITQHGAAHPVIVPTDSSHLAAAQRAIEAGCGRAPVLVREGATIPVVSLFKSVLGLDTLLVGFGLHDDALHSPNEKFELANFDMGCRTHAALLQELTATA